MLVGFRNKPIEIENFVSEELPIYFLSIPNTVTAIATDMKALTVVIKAITVCRSSPHSNKLKFDPRYLVASIDEFVFLERYR